MWRTQLYPMKISSIAIIEDDDKVRTNLSELIAQYTGCNDIRQYMDSETALSELIVRPAEIVLTDVNLPGINGVEFIRKIKLIHPSVQCIVLTVYDQPDIIFDALQSGATGYLLKSTAAEKIIEGIYEVFSGGSPISSQIARKVIDAFALKSKANEYFQLLSRREQEILEQLSKGFRYKEIADNLFLSIETVRSHVRNIYEKLQVNSRVEALKKTGLI